MLDSGYWFMWIIYVFVLICGGFVSDEYVGISFELILLMVVIGIGIVILFEFFVKW